jgi:hypothetical protein
VRRHPPLAVLLRHARGARARLGLGCGAAGSAVGLGLCLVLTRLARRRVSVELVD